MLEKENHDTGCKILAAIALDQVTDENVERMADDFRTELVELFGLGQISQAFYERWDRIMSGLHQPDTEELEQMAYAEGEYGGIEECMELELVK